MKRKRLLVLLLVLMILTSCGKKEEESVVTEEAEYTIQTQVQERMEARCREIVDVCADLWTVSEDSGFSRSVLDAMEERLAEEGYAVVDTDANYPAWLRAEGFDSFWSCVCRGEPAEQEVVTILESGGLGYILFTYDGDVAWFHFLQYTPGEKDAEVQYEQHEVLDWTLTDRGNFYYQIYPAGNKHYDDYTLLRTNAPDRELWDLQKRYITPGGYIGTNLFLTNWTETDWGELSFNDVWDYLYFYLHGEQYAPKDTMAAPEWNGYWIPAGEFEEVILAYFDVDLDLLRQRAWYDAEKNAYPWRPVETNDYVFLQYYTGQPEVTACRNNKDGTLTLTVQMLSTDLKMDSLFAHEVTVRPGKDGTFRYVGNQVVQQTEYGLPFCEPRLSWGEAQ